GRRSFKPSDVRQKAGGGGGQALNSPRAQVLLDQRGDALGVDDVGGEKVLHVAGDLRARLLALFAQRGGQQRRQLGQPFGAEVQREQQVALRGGHFAGHAQTPGAVGQVLRVYPQLVDLLLDAQRGLARGVRERCEE